MSVTPYIQYHLFRMLHIDNLERVLREGMYAPNARFDPAYVNIGDEALIAQRGEFNVPIAPGGVLSDYVPFYFGGCSPMLLNIKTGYRGIRKRSQSEIIYLCTHIETIIKRCPEWCFTDGHAKDKLTAYYNQLDGLALIDWDTVTNKYWSSTPEDPDKMRRKQAEFLVRTHVPTTCLSGAIVHDEAAEAKTRGIMNSVGIILPIHIDKKHNYYYND